MVYLGTSALAKRYLNEARSDDFEDFLAAQGGGLISTLTVAEMRCLLARRRREGSLDGGMEARVFAAFEEDILDGVLTSRGLRDDDVWAGVRLIDRLRAHALRTLDALHLASALAAAAEGVATADRAMAAAARDLGFEVAAFW